MQRGDGQLVLTSARPGQIVPQQGGRGGGVGGVFHHQIAEGKGVVQAKALRRFAQRLIAHLAGQHGEGGIAAFHKSVLERQRAVRGRAVVGHYALMLAKAHAARAGIAALRRAGQALQCSGQGDHLEGAAGRAEPARGAVKRLADGDGFARLRIVIGEGLQGVDFARLVVHHHDGAAFILREQRGRVGAQAAVQRQGDIVAAQRAGGQHLLEPLGIAHIGSIEILGHKALGRVFHIAARIAHHMYHRRAHGCILRVGAGAHGFTRFVGGYRCAGQGNAVAVVNAARRYARFHGGQVGVIFRCAPARAVADQAVAAVADGQQHHQGQHQGDHADALS